MKASVLSILTGILTMSSSMATAYLDSSGYWNYPKDFLSALFTNRGSEQIGLGILGLQLFHYFIVGVTISAFGASLLVVKKNKTNPLDYVSPESISIVPSERVTNRLAVVEQIMTKSAEKSDFIPEIAVVKTIDPTGIQPLLTFRKVQNESVESLINTASSLITDYEAHRAR